MGLGYVLDGKYHKGVKIAQRPDTSSTYRAWGQDQQRLDHQWELVQPYTRKGEVNPDFIEAYPEEARTYGFTKETNHGEIER